MFVRVNWEVEEIEVNEIEVLFLVFKINGFFYSLGFKWISGEYYVWLVVSVVLFFVEKIYFCLLINYLF